MVTEPASSSFLLSGLSSSGKAARFNLARNGADDYTSPNPSPEALKNRSGYPQKHASHPLDALRAAPARKKEWGEGGTLSKIRN